MPKPLQTALLMLRELLFTAGPFTLLAAGLLWGAYAVLQPNPPRKVVLATGVAQGAYAEFGKRYAAQLARHGIQVQLRETQGSAENLALLLQPGSGVDLAFVQGGTWQKPAGADRPDNPAGTADAPPLQSLGRMFHEPVWLFYREDSARRLAKAAQITRYLFSPPPRQAWRAELSYLCVGAGRARLGQPDGMTAGIKLGGAVLSIQAMTAPCR